MLVLFVVLATVVAANKQKPVNKTTELEVPKVSDDVRDSLALPKEMKCEGCRAAAFHM